MIGETAPDLFSLWGYLIRKRFKPVFFVSRRTVDFGKIPRTV
jgi:hypothetical protein